jgi:hypothetical protein
MAKKHEQKRKIKGAPRELAEESGDEVFPSGESLGTANPLDLYASMRVFFCSAVSRSRPRRSDRMI